jgi:hypothetical protein
MTNHKHESIKRETFGFCGYSVAPPPRENRVAHGGVTHVDHCRCGAKRLTNSTGFGRDERGPWEQVQS